MIKVSKILKLDYPRPSSKGDKENNFALEMININNNPLENEVKINQSNNPLENDIKIDQSNIPFQNEVKIDQTNNPFDIEVRKYQVNIPHENEVRIDQKDPGSIDDKSSIVPIKFFKEPIDSKFVLQNQEVDIEFSFMYEIKRCFCIKDSTSKTYDYAAESLDYSMDIETLITKYNEIEMIKQYLFDESQTKIFETLSRISTVQRFFSQIKQENENIFEDNDEKIKLILNEVSYLLNRGSKTDKKLLSFFRALFNLK